MSYKIFNIPLTSGFFLGLDIGMVTMKVILDALKKYQDSKKPKVCLDCPLIQNSKSKVKVKELDGY